MKFIVVKKEKELEFCYEIRKKVFVKEQKVPLSEEIDIKEDISSHFLVEKDGDYIATGRLYRHGEEAVIGRIAVIENYRGCGVGIFLMQKIIDYTKQKGYKSARLGSQEQAIGFYEKFGFNICSDAYMDANIVHYLMRLVF